MFKKSVLLIFVICSSAAFSQSRFELSFHIGYSNPLLESHGDNFIVDSSKNVYINGKRLLVSDNLAANAGYNVTTFLKYSFTKNGQIKGLFSLGYNALIGSYKEIFGFTPGIRIQTFSLGLGAEVNPLGQGNKKFYPTAYGLFRLNLVGGESYLAAGLDIFKVSSRFGYLSGLNLNYRFKKSLGMYLGYSYSYDNLLDKQTAETYPADPHVIPFRDKASTTNSLVADRRVVYWSLYLGMNFFF